MKRDHMMGFVQTADDPADRTVYLQRRFPLGTPQRVWNALGEVARSELARDEVLDEFEGVDHTPVEMRKDFPREYDVRAMTQDKVNDAYRATLAHLEKERDAPVMAAAKAKVNYIAGFSHENFPDRVFPTLEQANAHAAKILARVTGPYPAPVDRAWLMGDWPTPRAEALTEAKAQHDSAMSGVSVLMHGAGEGYWSKVGRSLEKPMTHMRAAQLAKQGWKGA